ncbi:OmpH family outer membrane protein [Actibacterium sp. XHP0104]|uniref:OmpH family outer membrane protein n=1 Tax=Actibacterium sp. XHP0104 TaxID=2984335 RepID=UPI0021E93529|nr:OmpH family outer membrane protein [Actibacterium sp. XHP0104]MCV2881132.1 OmpH family outer membrane protein [Actibacterium sp. XHP0104]
MARRLAIAAVLAALALPFVAVPAVVAQEAGAVLRSPILTIDRDEVFNRSAYGRAVQAAFDDESNALAAENRRIETQLLAEERALTNERPTLDPAIFREKAAAFDEKVVAIRKEQDEKGRALIREREEAQAGFINIVLPVLSEIARERGAVAVLESRSVLMAAGQIDITDEAIARIDARLSPPDAGAAPQ